MARKGDGVARRPYAIAAAQRVTSEVSFRVSA
jgi:hypothetical protein